MRFSAFPDIPAKISSPTKLPVHRDGAFDMPILELLSHLEVFKKPVLL
jgi:hypothetical protein